MSGTSLDGIDAVLVEFHGDANDASRLIKTAYQPYSAQLREQLLELHRPSHNELERAACIGNTLATAYAVTVNSLLKTTVIRPNQITAIGCHGQTVRHRPDLGFSLQLGNPALLAELAGIATVADFRNRDIAAGGQGAPLVPAFHQAMFQHTNINRVIVNIGGIANLTNLPISGDIAGFDCGPGNMLMDAWNMQHFGQPYDKDGTWAGSGNVMDTLLDKLQSHSFFSAPPPKSTGREAFNLDWLNSFLSGQETPADVQATLLALTVKGIQLAITEYCVGAREVYLCGGGARNPVLVEKLQRALPDKSVALTDALGVNADWVEAFAFAWLARQTWEMRPGNLPRVTGARHPCILGAVYHA